MKISNYTFLFSNEESYYIYNSLSNALMEIDGSFYTSLLRSKTQKNDISEEIIVEKDFFKILNEKRFIVENDKDEFLLYKSIINCYRNSKILDLTIAPTMDCNYSCSYCFESSKGHVYMNKSIEDSIVSFVQKQEEIQNVNITWFGGEPLMAIDIIEELYNKLSLIKNKKFTCGMITNGFFISEEVIRTLLKINILYLQITLDGNKDNHNKIKYTASCPDTFSRTISNIDLVAKLAPEIKINIRVNLDKNNSQDYVKLFELITNRYKNNPNISILPAFTLENQVINDNLLKSTLFTRIERSKFIIELFKQYKIATPFSQYPRNGFVECSIRNKNVLVVDPEGYIYKCWEIIGNKDYAVGKLDVEGKIINTNYILLNRYLYGADPLESKACSSCEYLPICAGGCPHSRIENEYYEKHKDTCTHLKGFLPDILKIHMMKEEVESL